MLENIDRIASFIGGLSLDEFIRDERAIFAVSYAFVRLGEAARHIPQDVVDANPSIEWREIRQFRNFMVHVYQAVDPARLHDTALTSLSLLRTRFRHLMKREQALRCFRFVVRAACDPTG